MHEARPVWLHALCHCPDVTDPPTLVTFILLCLLWIPWWGSEHCPCPVTGAHPCQIVRDSSLWMPPNGWLNLSSSGADISTAVSLTRLLTNYHLERPINGQNRIVQHVYKHDQFTGTIQKMIKSNKMKTKKKTMDLQAFHDNFTCSPNEVSWTTHHRNETEQTCNIWSSTQSISGYENIT